MIPKKIVAAFDGSPSGQKAFRYALLTAKQNKARLWVVSVIQIPEPAAMEETEAVLESGKQRFELLFKPLRKEAQKTGVNAVMEVVMGHPAEQIILKAKKVKADLVVVGYRGHSRIRQWLLGSVSKRISSYAPCAVTIVR